MGLARLTGVIVLAALAAAPMPQRAVPVAALDKAREAAGGGAALAAITSLVAKGQALDLNGYYAQHPQGNVEWISHDVETRVLFPDRYRVESLSGGITHRTGFSGVELLDATFRNGQPLRTGQWPDQLALWRDQCARLLLLVLLRGDVGVPLSFRPNSSSPLTIEVTGGMTSPMFLDLDPATSLPLRLRYHRAARTMTGGMRGDFTDVVETPSDYRLIGRVRVPHHLTFSEDGTLMTQTTFTEIRLNAPLTAADFKK